MNILNLEVNVDAFKTIETMQALEKLDIYDLIIIKGRDSNEIKNNYQSNNYAIFNDNPFYADITYKNNKTILNLAAFENTDNNGGQVIIYGGNHREIKRINIMINTNINYDCVDEFYEILPCMIYTNLDLHNFLSDICIIEYNELLNSYILYKKSHMTKAAIKI